jgi:hypothetical protein
MESKTITNYVLKLTLPSINTLPIPEADHQTITYFNQPQIHLLLQFRVLQVLKLQVFTNQSKSKFGVLQVSLRWAVAELKISFKASLRWVLRFLNLRFI